MSFVDWSQRLARRGLAFANGLTGEFVPFAASTLAYQFSRLAVSLIVARWVGPEEFGIWNALNLLLLYGVLVTLGVPNAMNRDVPLLIGQGDNISAQRVASISFWFVLFSGIGTGLAISFIAINGRIAQQYRQPLMWMGPLFFAWQVYQYFQLHLKCNIRFNLMSLQQFVFAALLPVVVLPLARVWRIPGFIIGQAVVAFVLSVFISRTTSFKIALSWNWRDLLPLTRTGFPIMAAGLLYSLLTSVDRWVILTLLGAEALGHYTLVILCRGILSLLPAVVSQQMYPRMAFRYGQTGNKRSLFPLVIRQSLMGTAVTVPILAIVYVALPFLVDRFLPAYALGVTPARILLVGLAFIPLAGGIGNFLNTVDKQVYYLMVQAGVVLVNFSLDVLLVKIGWGLNGVALGVSVTYFLYAFGLIGTGYLIYRSGG